MSDQDIATVLLERCSRRLSGIETAICRAIMQLAAPDLLPGVFISTEDRRTFEGLKTQFAADLK